jgi:hypothetical protein
MIARRCCPGLLLSLLLTIIPGITAAQRIEFSGRGDFATDGLIRRTLREGAALVLTRDTLLSRADTIRGSVIATGVTLRLEGVIQGDLFGVDANLFLRPRSHITGSVTNVAGGYFPAENVTVDGGLNDLSDAPYDVVLTPEGARIIGTRRPAVLDLGPLRGLREPAYDRVDGLTLSIGGAYYFQQFHSVEPWLRASAGYASRRDTWKARIETGLLSRFIDVRIGAERATATQDEWIRTHFHNTVSFFFLGEDYRDYYRADRGWVGFTLHLPAGFDASLTGALEEAASLQGGEPWTLTHAESLRPNPPINDGRIISTELGLTGSWESLLSIVRFDARAEIARKIINGEFHFARYELDAAFSIAGLRNHTLDVLARMAAPLPGTDSLPLQRWGVLGGDGTLETFDVGRLRGDRVALFRSTYHVPLDPMHVPILGYPAIELIYAAGNAWDQHRSASLEQALGLRLRFALIYGDVFVDPADADDLRFGIGLAIRQRPPWESANN